MVPSFDRAVLERAARVRLLALDVDGVLTDGSIVYTESGEQVQGFHVHDGLGIKLLMEAGVEVAIISSRSTGALVRRAKELGIARAYQGVRDKIQVYEGILHELGLEDGEVAYVGDDWVDLPLLKRVGLAVAVADATAPMKDHVHYVTRIPGGQGAVREVCDLILTAKGLWNDLLNSMLTT